MNLARVIFFFALSLLLTACSGTLPTIPTLNPQSASPGIAPTLTVTLTPSAALTPMASISFDSVILSDGDFTPDTATIEELETKLPDYLAQNQQLFNPTKPPIVERLPNYKVQYWGEINNGKRTIVVNAMCTPIEGWQKHQVMVLDGGDCFFMVKYDPETKTFMNLSVNGEA